LAVLAVVKWHKPAASYLLVGAAFYLLGTVLVTMLFNVPRNEALATMNPSSPEAANFWVEYVSSWTTWNHIRTIAAFAASASLTVALYLSTDRATP
jgi:uncharacterized membrane protein